MPKYLITIIGLLVAGLGRDVAVAVNVWSTTGNGTQLLSQQPDTVFGATGNGIAITVDPSQTFQTMDGYGAALTNSSAWLLQNRLNNSQRERLLGDLFSTTEGVGLNQLRLVMGASDFTASGFYTYNDLPAGQSDPQQNSFSIDPDRDTILPSLHEVRDVNPNLRLMGSPWSAPGWMKTSGSVIGGSLKPELQASYATYLRKFVEAYAAEGHTIDTLTLQNEPLFTPGNYPGMAMSAAEQIDLVKNHVGPQFAAAGIDTKLFAYDHNWDNTQYPIDVLNDPDARQYLAGTAFHGYAGNVSAQTVVRNAHPDKSIYFTELSGGDFAPNFEDNLIFYTRNLLIGGARNWGSSVMLWNLALDENSGPHLGGCDDCRGVVTIDSASGDVTYNEEFYALAHASRFVQPGAVRIGSTSIGNLMETVAFENPDGSRTLLALNPTTSTQAVRVFDGGQNFRYEAPARSVLTFTWTDDDVADFDNGSFEVGGFGTTGGSLDGWLAWGVTGDNVEASTLEANTGEHALRLTEPSQSNGFSGVSQGITVSEGDRIVVDAQVLLPDTLSISESGNSLLMKVEYYDVYGGQFQSNDFLGQTQSTVANGETATGEWISHRIDSTAPDGAVEARLVFAYSRSGNDAGAVFVDDIIFRIAESLAGDFNQDGTVDAADYTVWREGLGTTYNEADYATWRANYGQTLQQSAEANVKALPEPSGLFVIAILCLCCNAFQRSTIRG